VLVAAAREESSCPLCDGRGAYAFNARDRGREASDERFDYHRCRECGTLYIADVPADLHRYYPREYYFSADGEPLWRLDPRMPAAESERIDRILNYVNPGVLIEIGAGSGTFAQAAKDAGFDVTAIEMDATSCAYIEERVGVRAICTDTPLQALDALALARVICLWHVLEHLPDPGAALKRLADQLEPGGLLVLGVPNPDSLQFRVLRRHWPHLEAPRHLCLIPPGALIGKARELGLEPVFMTTDDLFGRACNLHGWMYGIRRRPAAGPPSTAVALSGISLTRMLAPIERRGVNGTALTVLLRRTG
jgi:SAM-dependent methyltransferase